MSDKVGLGVTRDRWIQVQIVMGDSLGRLRREGYQGYDPADLLNTSWTTLKRLPAPLLRALTVINVRSPVNLRRLLRIKPATNTTALAVLGRTCVNWCRCTGSTQVLDQARELADRLLKLAIVREDAALGWPRITPYQAKATLAHTSGSALTFINAYGAELFMDLYEETGEERYRVLAAKVCAYLLHHTLRIEYPFGTCLSYVSQVQQEVPNASILAGAALNRLAGISGDNACLRLSLDILDYTLHRQNADGSWDYSYHPVKGSKPQYDFHQCYMLDAIRRYAVGLDDERTRRVALAFNLGLQFYRSRMFDSAMYPLWRYPRKYPIDIHNVSHAVYLFARYCTEIPDLERGLDRLLSILLDEFYDPVKKYFYYQRFPFLTVKHDFFRWNTAWSLYALSQLPGK